MNNNAPIFKKIQKIARYFNSKPIFLDVDIKTDKVFFRPYKKHRKDILQLIFVAGIPIGKATVLMLDGWKKFYEDGCFIRDNIIYIHNIDGLPIGAIKKDKDIYIITKAVNNRIVTEKYNEKDTNVRDVIKNFKEEHHKQFTI